MNNISIKKTILVDYFWNKSKLIQISLSKIIRKMKNKQLTNAVIIKIIKELSIIKYNITL